MSGFFLYCSTSLETLSPENSVENNELAFYVAEKHLGISSLIKPTEMEKPDRLALVTYLSLFYELFQDSQPFMCPAHTRNELEVSVPAKVADETECSREAKSTSENSSKTSERPAKAPSTGKPVEKFVISHMPVNSSAVQTISKEVEVAAAAKSDKSSKQSEKSDKESQKKKDKSDKKVGTVGTSDKKTDKPSKQSDNMDKKANESYKKADKVDKWSDTSGKEAGTSGKQSDKPGKTSYKSEKLATSADKQLTSAKECTKKVETSQTNNVANSKDQITSPAETSDKKKKKKKKFHIFRRNKKKSLATATPSIER